MRKRAVKLANYKIAKIQKIACLDLAGQCESSVECGAMDTVMVSDDSEDD